MQLLKLTRRLAHPLQALKADEKVEDSPEVLRKKFERAGASRSVEKLRLHSTRELKLPLKDRSNLSLLKCREVAGGLGFVPDDLLKMKRRLVLVEKLMKGREWVVYLLLTQGVAAMTL